MSSLRYQKYKNENILLKNSLYNQLIKNIPEIIK